MLKYLSLYYFVAMDLVSSRNIEEMVFVLKNEVEKTHNLAEHEDTGKYRQLLVRTLHTCSIKVCLSFPPLNTGWSFINFTYNMFYSFQILQRQ